MQKGAKWAKKKYHDFLHFDLPEDADGFFLLISAKFGQKMTLNSPPIDLLEAAEKVIFLKLL